MSERQCARRRIDGSRPLPNGQVSDGDLHDLVRALQAMRMGDFSVRIPAHAPGILGKIADAFNDIAATNQHFAEQLEDVGRVVGKEGNTRQRLRCMAMGSGSMSIGQLFG